MKYSHRDTEAYTGIMTQRYTSRWMVFSGLFHWVTHYWVLSGLRSLQPATAFLGLWSDNCQRPWLLSKRQICRLDDISTRVSNKNILKNNWCSQEIFGILSPQLMIMGHDLKLTMQYESLMRTRDQFLTYLDFDCLHTNRNTPLSES